ncbi:MAG: PD-(D/E)XK nuclease family protein [Myxococcaceae bacterium]|nr:PD-(D/E)XK nuclease family protein [Myxococcaceae bacterium]
MRVLPDGARVEHAMVRAAAEDRGFVDGSSWFSFGQLVDLLGGARFLERRPCSPLTACVVLWACARKVGPGPFGDFVQEPAFARGALDLFQELKSGGLDPVGFRVAVERFPASRIDRARHLAKLYEAYEESLKELKLADREDQVIGALGALRQHGLPKTLTPVRSLELSGIFDFPWSRRELLMELAHRCEAAQIHFSLTVPAGLSPEVDGAVDPFLTEFERRAQSWRHVELAKEDLTLATPPRPLAGLGAKLFSAKGASQGSEPAPGLALLRAASPRHEVRVIARGVLARIEEGTPPERIAVAWPDLGEEAEWIVEELEALGVPARVRRGMPLYATSAGKVALDLPLLVDDGFPAEDVSRWVGSRYFPEISRRAPPSAAALLALASVRDNQLGAEDGRGAYEVRLNALLRRLEARDSGGRHKQVNALLEACRRLITVCGQLPAEGKAADLLETWWHALGELGLPEAVRQPEPRGAEGTAFGRAVLRALARDQAAFESLRALHDELKVALRDSGAGATRMARRTFHRWLLDVARDFNLLPRGPRGGAVHVLDVRELWGRGFEHVFVGGFTDGRFPGRETPHPLFPEEDRILVNAWHKRDVFRLHTGEGERRIPHRLAVDRLLLHQALSAAEASVTLTYPAEASGGAEQVPSPFWDELIRLTGVRPVSVPLRPVPPLDEVRSELELRERTALELFSPPELRVADPDPAAAVLRTALAGEAWLKEAEAIAAIDAERLTFFGDPERPPGPWSGLAHRDDLAPALARAFEFGRDRPLSASMLQRFGNCAFQGFLSFALRLKEPEEPGEEIDARGQGSFWHRVLELLFPKLKERDLLSRKPEDLPPEVIDEALAQAAADAEATGHTGHPALWRLGREKARRMVRRVLSFEARGLPWHFLEPSRTELTFGREGAEPRWREVAIPGADGEPPIHVEGKIDRIDTGNGALGVVDYKSSRVSRGKALLEALLVREFQLPLYLYAARAAGHGGALKAAWLSLKDGAPVDLETELRKHELTLEDLLTTDPVRRAELEQNEKKNLITAVQRLVSGLRQGRFPARPDDCGFCPYQRVCRITQRRMPEATP